MFIDEYKMRWGCRLQGHAHRSQHLLRDPPRPPSQRALRDEYLNVHIRRVWKKNFKVSGADKVWVALNREGIEVASCTVERLMREMGIQGARRGRKFFTTIPAEEGSEHPADLVKQIQRTGSQPLVALRRHVCEDTLGHGRHRLRDRLLRTNDRRMGGSAQLRTDLCLDALEQAIWARNDEVLRELIHHSDRGSQLPRHPLPATTR